VRDVIPGEEIGRVRDDIVEAADTVGRKTPFNTYLATTINFTQSFASYIAGPRMMPIVEALFGPHARVSSTTTQINEPGNERGAWHSDWPFNPLYAGQRPQPLPDTVMKLSKASPIR